MEFHNIQIGMSSVMFKKFQIRIFRIFGIVQSIPIPIQFISELSDFGILDSDYVWIGKTLKTFSSKSDGIRISYPSGSPN